MDDGLHGLFHVLPAHPFQPRMEGVLAGEDIGAGQPHERQPRAVGAAADARLHRRQPGAADRLHRMVDDFGVSVDHLFRALYCGLFLLDAQVVSRARCMLT